MAAPTGPQQRFRLWRRLGIYQSFSATPDSGLAPLRIAARLGAPLRPQLPLEQASVLSRLGQLHWRHQRYDSARRATLGAVQVLAVAFPDSSSQASFRQLDGRRVTVAVELAANYANAGLAWRAQGRLSEALRCYALAHRAYAWAPDTASQKLGGLAWVHTLFAENLREQGAPALAASHYEQALSALRAQRRYDWNGALQEWATTLQGYAPYLLSTAPPHLQNLAAEEQTSLRRQLRARPHDRDLLATASRLAVLLAQAHLATSDSASGPTLAWATDLLVRLRAAAGPEFRGELDYYGLAAQLAQLRAGRAATKNRASAAHWTAQAQAYTDSVSDPDRRARLGLELAREWLRQRNYAAAITLLGPLSQPMDLGLQPQLGEILGMLAQAYARQGRYDKAFSTQAQAAALLDTLRGRQQRAAVADADARYRTSLKEVRIRELTVAARQQQRQLLLAGSGAGLLALLLGSTVWLLRRTRRLNRRLVGQRAQLATQAAQLTELDRTKNAFFANVSHELRTPLTLVVGPLEQLMRHDFAAWEPPVLRRRLATALRNGQRLEQLVNGLLDLSKLDAGKLTLHLVPVRAAAFFQQLLGLFENLVHERNVALRSTVALPAEHILLLDTSKIEQVVTNLLANAFKFTPSGGHVTVSIAADPAVADGYQLTVADTGPGIAPDERSRIFERFYQSRNHQTQGGTGIGLSLSRELAHLMSGSLNLATEAGTGATFVFRFRAPVASSTASAQFPTASPQANPPEQAAAVGGADERIGEPAAGGAQPQVLLVEDHADMRAYLREVLVPTYAVREAANGHEALARLAEEPADLIISDEMMPGMSGTELLRHLQQQPDWRAVPFLLVTARADVAHRLLALDIGVADYLGKPFVTAELLARVRNLLRNQLERRRYLNKALPTELKPGGAAGGPTLAQPVSVAVASAPVLTASDAELLSRLRAVTEAALADETFGPVPLAAAVGLSERTLYRRLKELTGFTPSAFVREVRLLHARHLLETRAVSTVAEAAFAVGFANASHFGRVYTERFGRPPGEDKA